MAKQIIPQALRNALWVIYDHRCFYCRENVPYDLLEIDHIVPEGLSGTPAFSEQLASYGLNADWDLTAAHNLAPACPSCNARKAARLPDPKQMALFLTHARDNVSKVEAARVRLLERIRRENLLAQLAIALETGRMTDSDVTSVLRQPNESSQSSALLAVETYFVGVPLVDLRPDNVEQLFDRTVRLGGTHLQASPLKVPKVNRSK
jgi:5-methylcytosine-specific restriction endonuclease McrA